MREIFFHLLTFDRVYAIIKTSSQSETEAGEIRAMTDDKRFEEQIISAWIRLTGLLKNTRITQGMIYNEAIVMLLAYHRYLDDGEGLVSFKEIVQETHMLKSLVNRTIDSLVEKGLLVRCDGKDKRTTFVRVVKENLGSYLEEHDRTLALVKHIIDVIGREDAEAFVRIAERICEADPLNT